MAKSYLGRHPIFDYNMNIYGYELLFRNDGEVNQANVTDGNMATTQVINNLYLDFGLENIVGTGHAFINLPKAYLESDDALPFEAKNVVLEILEDVEVDDNLIRTVIGLRTRGFLIALDDYCPNSITEPLLDFVDIVKVDLPQYRPRQLVDAVRHLRKFNVKLLAEKVETEEEHRLCQMLKFDYYQGYFFCKPKIISGDSIPQNKMAVIRALQVLQDPDVPVSKVEELVSQNVSFSYKILKYINSAAFSLVSKIESVKRAIAYIGLIKIKQWLTIMSISSINDRPETLAVMELALIRSHFAGLIAQETGKTDLNPYQTTGLFSVLDVLMNKEMEFILNELPLTDEINKAILNGEGHIGDVLSFVIAFERDKFEGDSFMNIRIEKLNIHYINSIEWAKELLIQLR